MTIRSYSFVVKISTVLLVVFSFILQILCIPIDPIDHHRNKNHCIDNRGTSGHWYYNETLGRQTFYRGGFRSNRWYQENANNSTAIYPGNAYGWHDNTEQQHCKPIQPVTKDSFCSTMKKIQIKRLLVVGDSLSLVDGQLGSLLALLGYSAWDLFATPKRPIQRDTIEYDNETISVQAFRENLGSKLLKLVWMEEKMPPENIHNSLDQRSDTVTVRMREKILHLMGNIIVHGTNFTMFLNRNHLYY